MLKELFRGLIFRVLGDYMEEISLDDMNINSWNGIFSQENISLKASAIERIFQRYGFNIRLVRGIVGKLFFQVPWTKIWKEPCHVLIENVHILGSLSSVFNYEANQEVLIKQKLSQLKEAEENEKKFLQTPQEGNKTKLKKFLEILIENMRFEVKNCHIRIEDPGVTMNRKKFAFGFVLDSMTLEPTNSKFEPHFVDPETRKKEEVSYSLYSIKGIGLYTELPGEGDIWGEREDVLNFARSEYAKFSREFYQSKDSKSYILKPTDIIIQKTSNLKDNVGESDIPTKFYNLFIDQLHFVMEDQQFKLIYYLLAFRNWSNQEGTHLMYRPQYGLRPDNKENARLWWDYAIKSVISKIQKQREEKFIPYIAKRRVAREKYIELFQVKVVHDIEEIENTGKTKLFTPEILIQTMNANEEAYITFDQLLEILINYEREFSFEECLHYRNVARAKLKDLEYMNQFIKSKIKEPEKAKNVSPWFFQKMLSKIGFQSEGKKYHVDHHVIENIEEFIRNNNIFQRFEMDSGVSPNKFHSQYKIHAKSIKVKLKQKVMNSQKFSFFNAKLDDLEFEYSSYESKRAIGVKIMNLNILDELTINKRFVNVLQFENPEKEVYAIDTRFVYERLSENPYNERKRINFSWNSCPFELILNKDLVARLNFMLKNPIENSTVESNFEIDAERIERKIKEKLLKHLGKNSKIEINTNVPGYALVFPKNPNIQDSPFFVLEGANLSITTKEQSQEGDSDYTISHEKFALKQVTKAGFSWSNSFEKSYQENSLTLLELSELDLLVQKSILGDGSQLVIDFNLRGSVSDIKIKTSNLSSLLLKPQNNLQVNDINKSSNDIQFQSLKESGFSQVKESQEVNKAPKSDYQKGRTSSFLDERGRTSSFFDEKGRTSSFFDEAGSHHHARKQSLIESYGHPYPRKESSHMYDSAKGNDETEEFFEAFEDLAEMLEAEQVIEEDFKLEIGRETSALNKNKGQGTFQLFTLKYIRWSFDLGIQNLSIEIGLEEDFGLTNSYFIFEQKEISIQAGLAPEETNINLMYSSLKLQYSQKKNLEPEKCFEIKSTGPDQDKNVINILRRSSEPIEGTFSLGKIQLELQPNVTNEIAQLSKAFLARRGSSDVVVDAETDPDSETKNSLVRMGIEVHSFHIRLIGHDNNYVELQAQNLKLYKASDGDLNTSFEGLRFRIVNSKQKSGYDIIQNSKKQIHGESRIILDKSKSMTDIRSPSSSSTSSQITLDINNLKMIFDYKALTIAFPILIHYSSIIKSLSSSKKKEATNNDETKESSKLSINIKMLCLLFRSNLTDNLESSERIPDIYNLLTRINPRQVNRHNRLRNQIKIYFDGDLNINPAAQVTEFNFQLKLSFFHNNILNKLLDSLEGNIHTSFENGEKNTQIRIKTINMRISPYDIEIFRRFILDYAELYQNFGKSLINSLSSSSSQSSKNASQAVSKDASNLECLRFHLTAVALTFVIPSAELSERINSGTAKVEEMRADNQLGFVFDNINIGKVTKEREQIINFSINGLSSYLKSGIEGPRILLIKRIGPDVKRSPDKNSKPSFKLKYIQNKSIEVNLESTRIMFSDESYPKIKALLEELPGSSKPSSKSSSSSSSSSRSQPLDIKVSTKNLSFVYTIL